MGILVCRGLRARSACGCNAFGPGNRANATIGRALRLVLLNVGGGWPGELDKSTFGHPGKYTYCVAENEAGSPWAPYHDGWEYDYVGYMVWAWPNGVGQIPAIVGTVVRAKPHGQLEAGFVASFVATKEA